MPGLGAPYQFFPLVYDGSDGAAEKADVRLQRLPGLPAHPGFDPQGVEAGQQPFADQAVCRGHR